LILTQTIWHARALNPDHRINCASKAHIRV